MIDWPQHFWYSGSPVRVVFTPRAQFDGMGLKPGVADLSGALLLVSVAWACTYLDPYPGEFALEGADDATRELLRSKGLAWIASGDVTEMQQ